MLDQKGRDELLASIMRRLQEGRESPAVPGPPPVDSGAKGYFYDPKSGATLVQEQPTGTEQDDGWEPITAEQHQQLQTRGPVRDVPGIALGVAKGVGKGLLDLPRLPLQRTFGPTAGLRESARTQLQAVSDQMLEGGLLSAIGSLPPTAMSSGVFLGPAVQAAWAAATARLPRVTVPLPRLGAARSFEHRVAEQVAKAPGMAKPVAGAAPKKPTFQDSALETWYKLATEPKPTPPPSLVQRFTARYHAFQETMTDRFQLGNRNSTVAKREWRVAHPGEAVPDDLDFQVQMGGLYGAPREGFSVARRVMRGVRSQMQGLDAEALNAYLMLRHGTEVFKQLPGRKVTFGLHSEQEAAHRLLELKGELGDVSFSRVELAAKEVQEFYGTEMQKFVDDGMVAHMTATMLRERYPWYNPIRYIEDDVAKFHEGGGRTLSATRNDLRYLGEKGVELATEKPLDLIGKMAIRGAALRAQNRTAQALVADALLNPEYAGRVVKVSGSKPVARLAAGETATGEAKTVFRRPPGEITGTISYMADGGRVLYDVSKAPELERLAKLLPASKQTYLGQYGRFLNTVPRMALTQLNPPFWATNFAFDIFTTLTMRGLMPWRTMEALAKNLRAIVADDPGYARFFEAGAGQAGIVGRMAREAPTDQNVLLYGEETFAHSLKHPLRLMEAIGEAVENAPRRAIFERALSKGVTERAAGLEARRATVDFARAGTVIREANDIFLYLNAGVQGFLLPGRMLRDYPAARYGLAGYLGMETALYLWNRQFPGYSDVPEQERWSTTFIMVPTDRVDRFGNPVPVRVRIIPTLREFAVVSAPLKYLLEKLDGDPTSGFGDFVKTVGSTVNPLNSLVGGPTFIGQLATEVATNYDTYHSRPIVPPELEWKNAEDQWDEFTSPTAIRVGKVLKFSPKKIDYMVRNGVGWDIISGVDRIAVLGQEDDPETMKLVAALQTIVETTPPDHMRLERQKFLNGLTSEQRDRVEQAERKGEPTVPFVSGATRRFYRTNGGQQYRLGRKEAARALGVSEAQTVAAGRSVQRVAEGLRTEQEKLDQAVRLRQVTPEQWRNGHRGLAALWSGAFVELEAVYPGAAQALPTQDYQAFLTMVNTVAGATPDRRDKGELLLAARRAITPEEIAPGVFDFGGYYERLDRFEASLPPDDRALLMEERMARMTAGEQFYEDQSQVLRPYWDIERQVMGRRPMLGDLQMRLEAAALAQDARGQERVLQDPLWKSAHKEIRERKQQMRRRNPSLDASLRYWGYTSTSETPESERLWRGMSFPALFVESVAGK